MQSTVQHQLSLIAVYSGRTPESVDSLLLANAREIPVPAQSAPQMLPSDALLQRPDVRTAYATVEQRAAEVGVSKAQRYPQFRINLADGLLASSYLGLPTLTDNLFSAALNATSPIFNAGRITANIDASESRMRESQLGLQQTMLQALKEIEDNRSDLVSGAVQVQRLGGALDASNQRVASVDRAVQGRRVELPRRARRAGGVSARLGIAEPGEARACARGRCVVPVAGRRLGCG